MVAPRQDETRPSPKTGSISGAIAVTNAIKTSIASSASPANYSGGALNGALAGGPFNSVSRTVSVTTTANASTYTTGGGANGIVFTGTYNGKPQTETLALTAAGGGETIKGTLPFDTVTSIAVPAQLGTGGFFTFGVDAIILSDPPREIRVGGAGDLHVQYPDGTIDTITSCLAGEHLPYAPSKIFSDSTVTKLTFAY